jgi:hypothetical protein
MTMKGGKFEVGDKVRLTAEGAEYLQMASGCDGYYTMVEGLVGVVVGRGGSFASVRFDGHRYPTNGNEGSVGWSVYDEGLELVAPPATPAPSTGVTRTVGASVNGVHFVIDDGVVVIAIKTEDDVVTVGVVELDQLREVVKILEGGNV